MKYTEAQINLIENELNFLSESDLEQQYREMLDEVYGPAKIGGYEYDHATALKSVDPLAYNCGLADYTSNLLEDYTEFRPGYYAVTSEIEELLSKQESA